MLSMKTRSH